MVLAAEGDSGIKSRSLGPRSDDIFDEPGEDLVFLDKFPNGSALCFHGGFRLRDRLENRC